MPFDLSLPLFDTIAYPVFHQSVQPFEKSSASSSTVPLGSGVDPVALDSTLDSPLDFSGDASPWSDLLASPMFSLPNSGTVSETPLPPLDPSSEEPSSLFPPLPTPTALPYESSSTRLRPLPPLPVRPSIAPLQSFPSPTSSASMALPTPLRLDLLPPTSKFNVNLDLNLPVSEPRSPSSISTLQFKLATQSSLHQLLVNVKPPEPKKLSRRNVPVKKSLLPPSKLPL